MLHSFLLRNVLNQTQADYTMNIQMNESANIRMVKSIGDEYSWAKECLLDLTNDGIEVDYVVTDQDCSAYKTEKDLFSENIIIKQNLNTSWTRHLSKNFRRELKAGKNSTSMIKILNTFATYFA